MFLDSMKLRVMFMGVGLVALMVFLLAGGRLGPGNRGVIQIEYGIEPRLFEGAEVEVDGEPAGVLKPFGSATRTGFEVRKGTHRVRVKCPGYASLSREISIDPGSTVMLVLDIQDNLGRDGQGRPVVTFQ